MQCDTLAPSIKHFQNPYDYEPPKQNSGNQVILTKFPATPTPKKAFKADFGEFKVYFGGNLRFTLGEIYGLLWGYNKVYFGGNKVYFCRFLNILEF